MMHPMMSAMSRQLAIQCLCKTVVASCFVPKSGFQYSQQGVWYTRAQHMAHCEAQAQSA